MPNPLENLQQFNIAGNAQNALMQGMQVGDAIRQRKEAQQRQQAEQQAYKGIYQGDPNALNALAEVDPRQAYEMRSGQQQAQQKQQRDDFQFLGRLLDGVRDEPSYQQARNAAAQYGLDVSAAPANYDPNWVEQNKMIARAMSDAKQDMPLIAQELVNAGYQRGTPEFAEAARKILASKYSTVKTVSYNPGGGIAAYDTASGSITPIVVPNTGQAASLPPPPEGFVLDEGGSVGNGAGGF